MKINGCPLEFVQPEALRVKVMEPILLLGFPRFSGVDIRIRVKGGGYVSQLYGQNTRGCVGREGGKGGDGRVDKEDCGRVDMD